MSERIELNAGPILVTDQTDHAETTDTYEVCVDIDKAHNGPRVWVIVKHQTASVLIHPDEGDVSDVITINRLTGAIMREQFGDDATTKPRVVVEIQGGCLSCVRSETPVEVVLIDWDNIKEDPESDPEPLTESELKSIPEVY